MYAFYVGFNLPYPCPRFPFHGYFSLAPQTSAHIGSTPNSLCNKVHWLHIDRKKRRLFCRPTVHSQTFKQNNTEYWWCPPKLPQTSKPAGVTVFLLPSFSSFLLFAPLASRLLLLSLLGASHELFASSPQFQRICQWLFWHFGMWPPCRVHKFEFGWSFVCLILQTIWFGSQCPNGFGLKKLQRFWRCAHFHTFSARKNGSYNSVRTHSYSHRTQLFRSPIRSCCAQAHRLTPNPWLTNDPISQGLKSLSSGIHASECLFHHGHQIDISWNTPMDTLW